MTNFLIALNAVFPFFVYMTFGYCIRILKIADEPFLRRLNKFLFQAFFPLLMFYNLYSRDAGTNVTPRLVITSILSVLILILILFLVVPKFVEENAKRGVVIQAIYRSNFVLFALPLTANMFGNEGTTIASIMIAIIVPIYNVMAIIILEYFRGGKTTFGVLCKKILTNPMISGAIVGFLFYILKINLPNCVETPIAQFANLTTPMALFILGGTLKFTSMKKHLKYLIPSVTVKMILLPAIAIAISYIIHLSPAERFVYFTMFGTPTAAASFAMASNMGGDGDLAGELVVSTTTVSIFSIFLWILFMKNAGLI